MTRAHVCIAVCLAHRVCMNAPPKIWNQTQDGHPTVGIAVSSATRSASAEYARTRRRLGLWQKNLVNIFWFTAAAGRNINLRRSRRRFYYLSGHCVLQYVQPCAYGNATYPRCSIVFTPHCHLQLLVADKRREIECLKMNCTSCRVARAEPSMPACRQTTAEAAVSAVAAVVPVPARVARQGGQ